MGELVDYGPAPPDLVQLIERMRPQIDPERRLVMVKLLARTVMADGMSPEVRAAGYAIDELVTVLFRRRYPVDST